MMEMTIMKASDNYEVMFVFSEIQAEEEQEIASKSSNNFKPGKLYLGSAYKEFTKMIRVDQYNAMRAQFPDVTVIAKGLKSDFKFIAPSKEFNT